MVTVVIVLSCESRELALREVGRTVVYPRGTPVVMVILPELSEFFKSTASSVLHLQSLVIQSSEGKAIPDSFWRHSFDGQSLWRIIINSFDI